MYPFYTLRNTKKGNMFFREKRNMLIFYRIYNCCREGDASKFAYLKPGWIWGCQFASRTRMRLEWFSTCEGRLCHDTVRISSWFSHIDIGNKNVRILERCTWQKDDVNCSVFVTEAMLFLSFMNCYIWGQHKYKNTWFG